MKGEPEAVPRQYQEELSEESRRDHLAIWEAERATIEASIARLRDNPAVAKRDSELRFMQTQLKRIDAKVRRGQANEAA